MTDNQILVAAGKKFAFTENGFKHVGVRSLREGKWNEHCQRMAEKHARYMASVGVQGHQFFNEQRVPYLRQHLPDCHGWSENAAESWGQQSREAAAHEMYRSWRQSPGHWAACNAGHRYWGTAMSRGNNGVWYAAAVFADLT